MIHFGQGRARRLAIPLALLGLLAAAPGCGGDTKKDGDMLEVPERARQADSDMENFMKSKAQQKK